MYRRPTYRPNGVRLLEKARQLVSAFNALAERSPWRLKRSGLVAGSLGEASLDGPSTQAQSVGEARDLFAISVPEEPYAKRVAVPCFVVFAPGAPVPRAEGSVSNEGGLIRFGLDSRDDRAKEVR